MKDSINVLKALADQTRLQVLAIVGKQKEMSCQELRSHFDLSQPTLSHHFHKLIENEIISVRKEGTSHYYSLNTVLLKRHGIHIKQLINNK